MGHKMDTHTFITKDVFKNVTGCIALVEALTETIKLLFGDILNHHALWIAFIFSIYVGVMRFLIGDDHSKESFIMSMLNVVIIFLGAVGTYQVGIKSIEKFITK